MSLLFLSVLLLSTPGYAEASAEQIVINKGTNQLAFYQDNQLVRVFPVATGRSPVLTPEGNFRVVNKIINPPYFKQNIPGGRPNNPLGPRWLGLSAPGGSYGIHGNSNPASIGTYASAGCVRLYNEDIIWLFEKVPIGTPVKIKNNNINLNAKLEPETAILTINGNHIPEECKAIILDDKVMVALRPLAEFFGYNVRWDNQTNAIIVEDNHIRAAVRIGISSVEIDDNTIALSSPPILKDTTTYIPPDFFDEVLGYKSHWNAQKKHLDFIDSTVYLPIN